MKNCRCCNAQFGGGPNRIVQHVTTACPLVNASTDIVNEFRAIKAKMADAQASASDTRRRSSGLASARRTASTLASASEAASHGARGSSVIDLDGIAQPTIPELLDERRGNVPSEREVNAQWMRAFAATGTPFMHASNPEFRKAILMTSQRGKSYTKIVTPRDPSKIQYVDTKLPSDWTFRTALLDELDAELREELNVKIHAFDKTTGQSLTSDGWEDVRRRPLLNALAVNPSGAYFIKSIDTSGETKDKEYIAKIMMELIEELGPKNVVTVIMDGACRSAFPLITDKYPWIICMICTPHSLDLFLEDTAKQTSQGPAGSGFDFDMSQVSATLNDIRTIIKFITNHQKPLAFFRRIIKTADPADLPKGGVELLKPGETRFGTNFIAAQRAFALRPFLESLMTDSAYRAWVGSQSADVKDNAQTIRELILSENHWRDTELVIKITEPIFSLLRLCDGECARCARLPAAHACARLCALTRTPPPPRRHAQVQSQFCPRST